MTDEDKKRIVSEPPPPTDEIDGEWGDDDQTLVRNVPEGVSKSVPAPASAGTVSGTAVAPISTPPKAAEASTPPEMKAAAVVAAPVEEEEEDEEGDDEDEDDATENEDDAVEEQEEEDEDEDEHAAVPAPAAAQASADWLPDWAPFAVLAALVGASIVFGLGLIGGPAAPAEENEAAAEPAASAVKAPVKPSPHP